MPIALEGAYQEGGFHGTVHLAWHLPWVRQLLLFPYCQKNKVTGVQTVSAMHVPLPWTIHSQSSSHPGGAEGVRGRPGSGSRSGSPIAQGNTVSEEASRLAGARRDQRDVTGQYAVRGFAVLSRCLAFQELSPVLKWNNTDTLCR